MKQTSCFDGLSFDPFSLFLNDLTALEEDVVWSEFLQALVIASVVVMIDEGVDLLPGLTGQIVVIQQDAVLERLVPTLNLTLGRWVIRRFSNMVHRLVFNL